MKGTIKWKGIKFTKLPREEDHTLRCLTFVLDVKPL